MLEGIGRIAFTSYPHQYSKDPVKRRQLALNKELTRMATHQLGPESPRPFSVLSENHVRRHVELPYIPEYELFSFGLDYEHKMCELIHKYLELDTDDRLCYVGETRGSLVSLLQERFCLMTPVTTVAPGHIHYQESPNHKMLPFKVANVGAEEYFKQTADTGPPTKFDKVLLKDVIRYVEHPRSMYENILQMLDEFGKVVIVQRPGDMNTLPIFTDAKDRIKKHEDSYLRIIQDLQALHLDVSWDVECLPIVMNKSKWYSMLNERFPPQLEMVSTFEVTGGLRELSEGILKYGDERIEFVDRLLFITASRPIFSDVPQIARHGASSQGTNTGAPPSQVSLRYELDVTPEIDQLIFEKQRYDRVTKGRKGTSVKTKK